MYLNILRLKICFKNCAKSKQKERRKYIFIYMIILFILLISPKTSINWLWPGTIYLIAIIIHGDCFLINYKQYS